MNPGLLDSPSPGTLDLAPRPSPGETPFTQLVDLAEGLQRRVRVLEGELILLKDHVTRDPLTGLRNRWYMDERLEEELGRAKRYGRPCSVMLLDVDRFKEINDCRGHGAGDRVLCSIAKELRGNVRASDVVGRWGGDEFAVLLPETDETEAGRVGRRLLEGLRPGPAGPCHGTPSIGYTVSIGIAGSGPGLSTAEALVGMADRMMYRAKRSGGNRLACQCDSDMSGE